MVGIHTPIKQVAVKEMNGGELNRNHALYSLLVVPHVSFFVSLGEIYFSFFTFFSTFITVIISGHVCMPKRLDGLLIKTLFKLLIHFPETINSNLNEQRGHRNKGLCRC